MLRRARFLLHELESPSTYLIGKHPGILTRVFPPVSIKDSDTKYTIRAEIPGVNKQDIHL